MEALFRGLLVLNEWLNSAIPIFNIAAFLAFLGLSAVGVKYMLSRLIRLRKAEVKIPILLWRDIILFGTILGIFGSTLIVLLLGVTGLAQEWWWVMPRGIFVIVALAFVVHVERNLEDYDEPERDIGTKRAG